MEIPHPEPDAIAHAVSQELQRRGFTITFAASLAGVHRTALTRWLCGKRNVSAATAAKVLDALDLRVVHQSDVFTPHRNGVHQHTPR